MSDDKSQTAIQSLLKAPVRLFSLAYRGMIYLFRFGPGAFIINVRGRLLRGIIRRIHENATDAYEKLYWSLLNVASGQETKDYVPLSATGYPAEKAEVKLIAFYLPQFHPIPENDQWWGRGFTEWTNVSKAVPQFMGHYQPHLPGELGFYDLRVPQVQERQVELARLYGIYGFAFYYYWFNGRRLLEKPIDQFFSNKEIHFPFCIFWANENWTRRWDGKEEDVLISQEHTPESDYAFIKDIEPYFRDERYIHIDGKPVLLVYRVQLLPDARGTAQRWRQYCRDAGLGEIYLVAGQVYGFNDPREVGFDAAIEFPPHNIENVEPLNYKVLNLNPYYQGYIFDYQDFADFYSAERKSLTYKVFKTVVPAWDNEPRKPGKGLSVTFSTPQAYKQWLINACRITLRQKKEERVVFINAWNEWGEGAHLEPDRRFGYAYLQATAQALSEVGSFETGSSHGQYPPDHKKKFGE